ncbi:MAG: nitroreductase family protein [Oscillospiraceae bacterium]|nr:nitroreductase family protein [Oscillospiraceae bacterium]
MELKQAIFTRCSCRSFTDAPVTDAELNEVLAAANAAPVGMGAYHTVHLTVIRNKDFLAGLSAATKEFMKRDNDPLYGAPVLVLVSGKPGMPPTIEFQNASTIIENMLLTATDLGLGSVYLMGAIAALKTKPELVEMLGLPEGFVPIAAAAIGHSAAPAALREAQQKIETNYLD